jgi:hypothetical protein
LENKTAELERKLSEARASLERELAESAYSREAASGHAREALGRRIDDMDRDHGEDEVSGFYAAPLLSDDGGSAAPGTRDRSADWRTEVLVNHGRHSAYHPRLSRGRKIAIGTAAVIALTAILITILSSGGASWPSSVATVQAEIASACQNPDVRSEPGQVNFACAKSTRQILWVFALMTSGNNPGFTEAKTGRIGLEPITPAQGGEVAWSLNLHHPYSPSNPIDSLEVAARAINNIIGGATLTGPDGNPIVQPGLENDPANCARYTGSAAVSSHKGFPGLCAAPVTNPAGQAALVADVYQKWVVGASPSAAQNAAVLFENADNPGDPRVQAILKQLSNSKLLA